jgi:uncharacterized integral membrane protein
MSEQRQGPGFFTPSRIAGIALGILVIALAAANFDPVEVSLLIARFDLPLFFLIVVVLLIGYAAGWLLRGRSR